MPRAERDRTIDALRAVAIVGVVLGHWLVTAPVIDESGWRSASPLQHQPWMAALSWFLQTLAPFFFAGGYAAVVSLRPGRRYAGWLGGRIVRLAGGIAYLAAFWAAMLTVLALTGTPFGTLTKIGKLVVSPLWFLAVYLVCVAMTPVFLAVARRLGGLAVVVPVAVVAVDDLLRYGPWTPPAAVTSATGLLAILAGWSIPFYLGVLLATGRLGSGRRWGIGLVGAGAAAAVLLVGYAGYPASMVGVLGAERSNLNPPSLAALALAAIQVGVFLLLRQRIAAVLRRPRVWKPVEAVNQRAMPIYLWHQSALLVVILVSVATVPMPGLVDRPLDLAWIAHRMAWWPLIAGVLVLLCAVLARPPRTPARSDKQPRS